MKEGVRTAQEGVRTAQEGVRTLVRISAITWVIDFQIVWNQKHLKAKRILYYSYTDHKT
jgi:hypothetical protein